MSLQPPANEALQIWREAERLVAELPPVSHDHETASLAVVMSREAYHTLAAAAGDSGERLDAAHRQIEEARALLREVRARRGQR